MSIFLTLQTVLKLMMLSTDGEEGENSAGKKKKKKKKKKGCKQFFSVQQKAFLQMLFSQWLFKLIYIYSIYSEFKLNLQFTSQCFSFLDGFNNSVRTLLQ